MGEIQPSGGEEESGSREEEGGGVGEWSWAPVASLPSPPIPLVFTCPCDRGGRSDCESVCIILL